MDDGRTHEQANSFGRAAGEYERSRPTYPPEIARWLVPPTATTVVDVGAGTGKFTRALVDLGVDVIAVEPDPVMLATLSRALPGVRAVEGTAESMPLPDAAADVVTLAQAWHWVDPERALPEVARVLRPGGTLGLTWNIRDEREPWVAALSEVIDHSDAERFTREPIEIGGPFGPTEMFEVRWSRPMTLDGLLELVKSRSYIITASPEDRQRMLDGVARLVADHPDLAGRQTFELPYRTFAFRASLR